jgi:hypothetical protein
LYEKVVGKRFFLRTITTLKSAFIFLVPSSGGRKIRADETDFISTFNKYSIKIVTLTLHISSNAPPFKLWGVRRCGEEINPCYSRTL